MLSDTTPHYRRIAAIYLIGMCIQYFLLEGWGVSPVKVTAMCIAPVILLFEFRITSAIVLGWLYLTWIWGISYYHSSEPRIETMGYMTMFWGCYMVFYNLIYTKRAFSMDFFLILMERLLYAYIIVLIIQQILSLAGITVLPFLNMEMHSNPLKCQSLSLEPSHSARIMGVAFYAFLKVSEWRDGVPVSLNSLWKKNRMLLIGFLYAMLSIQSGTAIFILLILSLYFFHWKYVVPFAAVFILLPWIQSIIQSEQLDRVIAVLEATSTGDVEAVVAADHSASYRVLPMLNMFYLDFSDIHTWVGYGVDTAKDIYFATFDSRQMIGNGIMDYGMISYLLSLTFVFTCCIRPFLSLPTLMFFMGVGGGTNNIAYTWGILMIFTCVSYFYLQSNKNPQKQPRYQYSALEEKGFHTHVNF